MSNVMSNVATPVKTIVPTILDLRQENKRNGDHAVLPLQLAKLALKAWHDSLLHQSFDERKENLVSDLSRCKDENQLIVLMEEELYRAKLQKAIASNDYESFEVHV